MYFGLHICRRLRNGPQLSLEPINVTILGENMLADVLRTLRWRRHPGSSRWVLNAILNVFIREETGTFHHAHARTHTQEKVVWRSSRQRFRDTGFEDWIDVATHQEMQAAIRSWKRQRTDGLPESLEDVQPAKTLIWVSDTSFRLLASQVVRGQISVASNLQVCGNLFQQPQETNTVCKATLGLCVLEALTTSLTGPLDTPCSLSGSPGTLLIKGSYSKYL